MSRPSSSKHVPRYNLRNQQSFQRDTDQNVVTESVPALPCSLCGQNLATEPTSIRCDSLNCKRLFHPSCLGDRSPLCNELWFCDLCNTNENDVIAEAIRTARVLSDIQEHNQSQQHPQEEEPCLKETIQKPETESEDISTDSCIAEDQVLCPSCHGPVTDEDLGLECEGCFAWYHCNCQGVDKREYQRLQNEPDERWLCCGCLDSEKNFGSHISWGEYHGEMAILTKVNDVHKEISSWQKNNFLLPRGKAGNDFIIELTRLLNLFNMNTHLEKHAISLSIIFITLMTQKPSPKSKAKDNAKFLTARLQKWKDQKINCLLKEAREIQRRLQKQRDAKDQSNEKAFVKLMLAGKVAQAMKHIDANSVTKGVHEVTEPVLTKLKEKHPSGNRATEDSLLEITAEPPEVIVFENISADLVQRVTKNIHGSGGPSKVDADFFKHILCSKFYGKYSVNLCQAIADLTKRLAVENIDPICLRHFTSCRLIPLMKDGSTVSNIQVRPIGIGEVLRRITGKCLTTILRKDTQDAAGILQTCSGAPCAMEAAIHAAAKAFEDKENEAMLLIDASNAFNSLNRIAAIHNAQQLCPSIHQYLQNTYRLPADLIINNRDGEDEVLRSEEGATQGDVVAMQMYGIGIRPLIDCLGDNTDPKKCVQGWYADDASATGTLEELLKWWNILCSKGPAFGYFPNSTKTVLILKDKAMYEKADELFGTSGIKISLEGDRHLGAVVGTKDFRERFVKNKVDKWIADVENLCELATDEPQVAYSAYVKGLSHRWTFLQRTVKDVSHIFKPLEEAVFEKLMPAIIGRPLSDLDKQTIELPVRFGGLGIRNPRTNCDKEYENSRYVTETLTNQILNQDRSQSPDFKLIETRKNTIREAKEMVFKMKFAELSNSVTTPPHKKRLLLLSREKGAGAWLTALPVQSIGYALNKDDFRGSLCIRYGWRIRNMPLHCACGTENDINHSLICKTGGYAIFRHNTVRDVIAEILKEICKDVKIEPELIPIESDLNRASIGNTAEKARLDVSCVGLWSPVERTFMDVRVFHPNAPSYQKKSLKSLYKEHERVKKAAYNLRVIQKEKSTFTPMVFSTFGGMGEECHKTLQRAAGKIADKRKEKYSDVMGHITTKIRMSLLKTILLSVRGSRGTSKSCSNPLSSVAFNLIPGIEELNEY